MSKTIIGLDIGSTSVRAAQVSVSGKKVKVSKVAEVPLARGIVVDGDIRDPEALAESVQDLWQEGKFSSRTVQVGISGKSTIVRQVDLPFEDPETFRDALPLRVADELPIDPDELTLDYHPLNEFTDGDARMQRCLIVGAHNITVESLADAIAEAKLRISRVDYAPFGLIRLAHMLAGKPEIPTEENPEGWDCDVVVDVGTHATTVAIHYHSRPLFIRTVDGGGEALTRAISEKLAISMDDAFELQRQVQVSPEEVDAKSRKIIEFITAAMVSGLVQVVRESVDFFRGASALMAGVKTVYAAGGGTLIPGYAERLASELAAPVQALDPIAAYGSKSQREDYPTDGNRFANAVGVALEVKGR